MIALMLPFALMSTQPRDCFAKEIMNGVSVLRYLGDRKCIDFQPPRIFHGVYVDEFEGQAYYDGATSIEEIRRRGDNVWFSVDDETRFSAHFKGRGFRSPAYLVTFRGREATDMDREPLKGYGHMGMSAGVVLVDELIEAKPLGPTRD